MTTCSKTHDRELLSTMLLFRNASMETIEVYLERCRTMVLAPEELLLSPNRENRLLYLLLSGRLAVHLDSVTEHPFTTLLPGECAGEMSVIDQNAPSAFVIATEETHVLAINQDTLWALINSSHAVARNLLLILSKRVRRSNVAILDSIEMQRQSERSATVDPLTGLYNRRWIMEMYPREITRCSMAGQPLHLIMVDLDHFKQFNDRFGHLAGDLALQTVAHTMRSHLRPNDMVARFGGEEFTILLPDSPRRQTMSAAERLRKKLETTHVRRDSLPPVTASMGVAGLNGLRSLEELMDAADKALYRAKGEGRNRVWFSS